MPLKLLCAADFHLGRRPTRLPEGIDRRACSPLGAWERLIAFALRERPQAVLLAGDVVDFDNRYYEAIGPLENGVRQLIAADIPVYAVAGNHDFDVLPQIAEHLEGFHLLGKQGRWEELVLSAAGRPRAIIQGWSFPQNHVKTTPLVDFRRVARHDLPVIGLLHCETAEANSDYAPTSLMQLRQAGPAVWVLGHRHAPSIIEKALPLIFYCGSPQGLHPNETGSHGAWLLRIDDAGAATVTSVPLAGLRWEHPEIAMDPVVDEATFRRTLVAAINELHQRPDTVVEPNIAVGCRLALTGRTAFHREIARHGVQVREELRRRLDGVDYFIDQIDDRTKAAFPLQEIARHNDPPALLAQRLLLLEERQPADEFARVIQEAQGRLTAVQNDYYTGAATRSLSGEEVRETLLAAGYEAMDRLFDQKAALP